MRKPLSGLVEKGFKSHVHNWQRVEKPKDGRMFYLHVCIEHVPYVVEAYDMEVMGANNE